MSHSCLLENLSVSGFMVKTLTFKTTWPLEVEDLSDGDFIVFFVLVKLEVNFGGESKCSRPLKITFAGERLFLFNNNK